MDKESNNDQESTRMINGECIECGKKIDLSDAEEGELITCPECGTEMEVVSLNPPSLEPAPPEQEDWGE
jgi:alpha-aminoadipate carrier protein LysW